jgi:PAS domain S-box-containing protein
MKRKIISWLFLWFLLGNSNIAFAQNKTIDSLNVVLKVLKQDSNRVNTLILLCDAQSRIDNEKILPVANEILSLSEEINFPEGKAQAYIFLGVYNNRAGKISQGIDFFLKALRVYETLQDTNHIAVCYNNIGVIYLAQENYRIAYEYFSKALTAWDKSKCNRGSARVLNNIAIVYEKEKKDSLALVYYYRALKLNEKLEDKVASSWILNAIGKISFRRNQFAEALMYQQKALQFANEVKSNKQLPAIYGAFSEIYRALNEQKQALSTAEIALDYALQVNSKEEIAASYNLISKAYEAQRKFNLAYTYQSLYLTLNDSLQKTKNNSAIEKFRNNYEMEKKEKEISFLSHQHQEEIHKRNTILIALAGIVCVFLLIISRQRLNVKKRLEVERKNFELLQEQALRHESEAKYKTLIESTLLGVSIEKRGKVIYANKKLLNIFGYENMDEYSLIDPIHITDRCTPETKLFIEELQRSQKEGRDTVQSFIGHFYDKDNKVRSFEVQIGEIMVEGDLCRMYVLIDVTDRLAAEDASREMEKLFRLSQHFSNIGSWRWSFHTKDLLWSDITYKIYGVDHTEKITEQKFFECVYPDDHAIVINNAVESIGNGEPYQVEHRILLPNGQIRWVRLKGDVFRDSEGQPVEIFGVARDITESKQIAEELRLSKEKYRILAEAGHEIMGLYDLNGMVQYVSPAITHLLGYLPEDKVGRKIVSDIIHPMDRRQLMMAFRTASVHSEESVMVKIRMRRKDTQQYVWCQKSLRAIKDKEGVVTAIRSLTRDIGYEIAYETKLNQSNARLTNSVREYKSLNKKLNHLLKELGRRSKQLESTNYKLTVSQTTLKQTYEQLKLKTDALNEIAIIVSCDGEGKISHVNSLFEKIMGYEQAEIIGNTYYDLKSTLYDSPVHDARFFAGIWRELNEGKNWSGEVCYKGKDGGYIWCLKHMIPLFNNGTFDGYFSFSYDITFDKKREAELIEAKLIAEAASAIKEDFLSVMSHEIRTPLNSVIGLSNLLLKKKPREDQQEIIKTLKGSSDNLMHLVNDILDYNKIQAGKIELEEIAFNTLEFLQQFRSAYLPIASEKGLDFKVTADAMIPSMLSGDSMRLNQILNNLVNNAMKFTQSGSVKVTASLVSKNEKQCRLLFEVIDSGIGIADDKLPLIFMPFHQSEKYISRKFGGTGLGLSIVKSLVEMLGGEISVRSKEGEGSTFSVSIPFTICSVAVPHVSIKEINEATLVSSFKGYRVLYVEDVESNRMVVGSYLKDCEVECTMASGGELALIHTANKTFDVILMDLQMPGLNGYEVTQAIRTQKRGRNIHTPVIAFTAESLSENLKAKTAMHNIQDIVTKPFQFETLIQKIIKVTPRKREEEDFLSFQFYEDAFDYDRDEMEKIKKIVISDFKLLENNMAKHVAEKNMEGIRAEIHKLSPIVKNLKCKALIKSFDEFRKYDQYSPSIQDLHCQLRKYNSILYSSVEELQY